jgi:hypothetical protein
VVDRHLCDPFIGDNVTKKLSTLYMFLLCIASKKIQENMELYVLFYQICKQIILIAYYCCLLVQLGIHLLAWTCKLLPTNIPVVKKKRLQTEANTDDKAIIIVDDKATIIVGDESNLHTTSV